MSNKSIAFTTILTITTWYIYFAVSAVLANELEPVVIIFPQPHLISNLKSDTAIVSINSWSITLISPKPGLARSLYHKGGWIILPASVIRCLPNNAKTRI